MPRVNTPEDVLAPELLESPPSRVPTPDEIRDILEPWRPQKLRRIAEKHIQGHKYSYIFLRTYYGGGAADDAKLRAWIDQEPCDGVEIRPEDEWFIVLDDPELFNFGDDWQQLNQILPEVAAPCANRSFPDSDISEIKTWYSDVGGAPEDEDYEELIRLFAAIGNNWLLVLDEDAFQSGELGLMLRDKKDNVVKDSLIKPDGLCTFYLYCKTKGAQMETAEWGDAAVGREYRTRGSIMKKLIARVKAE